MDFWKFFLVAIGFSKIAYYFRAFFIALFRHLNFVGARACYRTSLEFCKLVYSLDPDSDPVGMLLLMDFYALRSQQYRWFINLFEELEPSKNLSQLPNWAFSVAVAYFYLAEEGNKDFAKADEMLQTALINFPGVLSPLLDKCSIEADSAAGHKFFLEAPML